MIRKAALVLSLLTATACTHSDIVAPEAPQVPRLSTTAAAAADFLHDCTGIVCEFYSANVFSKFAHWDFGHDATGVSPHVHHTFPQAGRTYTVTFRAIDVDDRQHVVRRDVDILGLTTSRVRVRGKVATVLTWAPANGDVDIRRNGVTVTTLPAAANQGRWMDILDTHVLRGSIAYQVCTRGTGNCSDVQLSGP